MLDGDWSSDVCSSDLHIVEEAAPVVEFEPFQQATVTLIDANTRAMLSAREAALGREVTAEEVEYIIWRSAESGKSKSAVDFIQAIQTIHRIGRQVAPFFEKHDLLLSPVLLQPPVPLGFIDTDTRDVRTYVKHLLSFFGFTNLFNATGQPSMSVPLYWTPDNLPVGLLFSSRFGEEALLLRLAAQLEQARPWKDRRPVLAKKG
jgi:amidase/6-aminohexanoate-cyclic-dimer hydrolase